MFEVRSAPMTAPRVDPAGRRSTTLDLLAIAAAAAVFALAAWVRRRGLDLELFLALNGWRGVPDAVWHVLGVAGLGVTMLVLLTLGSRTRLAVIAMLPWILVVGGGAVQLLKRVIASPRPAAVLGPHGFHRIGEELRLGSMPSGHAMTAAAVVCALWLAGGPVWRRPRSVAGAVALAAAVVVSRVMTGAHWPSDVVAGAALGWAVGLVSAHLARATRTEVLLASRPGRWLEGAAQIACGAAVAALDLGYYGALPAQWALGALGFGAGLRTLAGSFAPAVAAHSHLEVRP